MPKYYDKSVQCPLCGTTDTQAILDENDVGVVWCENGHMLITLGDGMKLNVINGGESWN